MMEFTFFNQSDEILFVRDDAESASWSVDEMNLTCMFPYNEEKKIERGMRIGFSDPDGVFQPFEVRKVRDYEPDHYQEITAEHIVISELTDYHTEEAELDNVTPTAALSSILAAQPSGVTGAARWQIGTTYQTTMNTLMAAYDAAPRTYAGLHDIIGQIMTTVYTVGNVNLLNRPQVTAADLTAAGWTGATGPQTLFTQYYDVGTTYAPDCEIHATPIQADGTIVSAEDFDAYIDTIMGQSSYTAMLNADKTANGGKGVVLWIQPVKKWTDGHTLADQYDEQLEALQAAYYQDDFTNLPTSAEIMVMYGSTVGVAQTEPISSGDIGTGSVWQNVRTIEENWNVYINPRVTFDANGITGRYLDIVPAEGTWHGVRLSIDKNMDEAGVTVDDTEVKTALYGYGGTAYSVSSNQLDKTSQKITLAGYTWTNPPTGASKNPADAYIVDTAATAMYGRNGQPRFGFYTNTDITDQATLAQKTWETLQTTNKPTVTVDCQVRDLYRMGYHDEPIRLHDLVMVELLPVHDILTLEIVKLSVDLLDPTATRPTIGTYIPNIVYIQRQTADRARGGSSGSISGKRGEETEEEAKWSEFVAEFTVNNAIFSYHASQIDHDNNVLRAAGLDIDANGAIIYAEDNVNMVGSKFHVHSDQIGMVVGTNQNGYFIKSGEICVAINQSGESTARINANRVYIGGSQSTTIDGAVYIRDGHTEITAGAYGIIGAGYGQFTNMELYGLTFHDGTGSVGRAVHWKSKTVVTGATITMPTITRASSNYWCYAKGGDTSNLGTLSGSIISGYSSGSSSVTTDTIYYLGRD